MKFQRTIFSMGVLATGVAIVWLGVGGASRNRSADARIYVAAAASLTSVLEQLGRDFERSSGLEVRLDFASSGLLRKKIEAGAPVDAFLSASTRQMDMLERSGHLVSGTRRDVLRNSLVCVVPTTSDLRIDSAEDLLREDIRWVAVGDPGHVPAGMYARQALIGLGLWERLGGKLAPSVHVRAAMALVETRTAQAAIVYRSDASITDKVTVAFVFPEDSHKPIVYPACVLKRARRPSEAKAFLDFLNSDHAVEVFAANGFLTVTDKETQAVCGITP